MRTIFDRITRLSLRFRWITVAITALLIGLGVYSYTQLNQELIPPIEFPQTFIFSQNGGANSDNMLHMYSIPLEDAGNQVDGVVNIETTSDKALSFVILRNEFGLIQSSIVDDIQEKADSIPLPVRRLDPPSGTSAADLIGQLDANHIAWLYAYAEAEDLGFAEQLSRDVWNSFKPAALLGFPESVFANLETDLKNDLLAKRSTNDNTVVLSISDPAPELPADWSAGDKRFKTVEDIAEMASVRNLAAVFNDFYEDGHLVGPLVYTDDLNADAIQIFLDIESKCRAYRQDNHLVSQNGADDPCSFIAYLNAEFILAVDSLRNIPDNWLPENYLSLLSNRDRNVIAQVRLIQAITGQTVERPAVELPDAWRVEAPQLLTFSFSDFPLGLITISSDELSDDELRQYVADVLVPALKDIDDVADVKVLGGETVPSYILNPELAAVGIDPIGTDPTEDENTDTPTPESSRNNPEISTDAAAEGPPLGGDPSFWQTVAERFGVGEFNSADDFFVTVPNPDEPDSETLYGVEIINWMATYQFTTDFIANSISADVLLWMGQHDPTTWELIAPETLRILPAEVVSQLPPEVQAKNVCTLELTFPDNVTPPQLSPQWQAILNPFRIEQLNNASGLVGINWQSLSGIITSNAADLARFADTTSCQTPSAFLNGIGSIPGSQVLLNTLSGGVVDYLAQVEPDFYENLDEAVINAFSWQTINQLPDTIQSQYNPSLGASWQQLSDLPDATQTNFTLQNVNDLIELSDGNAAAQLAAIMDILHNGQTETVSEPCVSSTESYCGFAVLLINDLSPDAFEVLIARNADFLEDLTSTQDGEIALTYASANALNSSSVSAFIDGLEDGDLKTILVDIRDGNRPSAAEILQSQQTEIPDDENAPDLPSSWDTIGGFIGTKLEQADDIINTQYLPDYESGADFINSLATDRGQNLVRDLTADIWLYLGENESGFWANLNASALQLIADDVIPALPEDVQDRMSAGGETFDPSDFVTRTDGNTSLVISVYKTNDANTVTTWHDVQAVLDQVPDNVNIFVPFEQSSFIEESIDGVSREGATGAVMAIIVILIFMNLSVRSTLVTSVSIPTSVMTALFLMKYVPSNVNTILTPILEDVGRDSTLGAILEVIVRLFPETYTLNIMTLSGLTVAIGRVVDDSIVVLENIYRNIQQGADQTKAILQGTREVSVAIFAATLTTMVVFLPLGLFGGVIGAIFLPFGLAVTYALAASYAVAITTVPVLAKFFINKESIPAEGQIEITSSMSSYEKLLSQIKNRFIGGVDQLSQVYGVAIRWVLKNRLITLGIAFLSLVFGMWLFGQRPQTFLPDFGEPTIGIVVNLPAETEEGQPVTLAYTEARVLKLEAYLREQGAAETVLTSIGGSLQSFDPTSGFTVVPTQAEIQVGMPSQENLDNFLPDLRAEAERIFGKQYVQVSGTANQGFGGFALELSGEAGVSLSDLAYYNNEVLAVLSEVDGLVNVESTLSQADGIPAIYFNADVDSASLDIDGLLADIDAAIAGVETDSSNNHELIVDVVDSDSENELMLMLSGEEAITFDQITTYREAVFNVLSENALSNVESTLGLAGASGEDFSYIRIDGIPAIRYTGELESADTLGITQLAIKRVDEAVQEFRDTYNDELNLNSELTVGEGFESEQQSDGVAQMFISMGIATLIVYFLLALTFGHAIHPITILVSLPLSIVGAAVALTVSGRAVGLSALIGMLMLIGIVVTNAVVLLDRVQQNRRENNMSTYDALVEAGTVRLRPILMTAISTMCGVLPLALGFAEGAIIAAELGTVVIGGLVSSTFLTLLVVPVVYSLFDTVIQWVLGLLGGGSSAGTATATSGD